VSSWLCFRRLRQAGQRRLRWLQSPHESRLLGRIRYSALFLLSVTINYNLILLILLGARPYFPINYLPRNQFFLVVSCPPAENGTHGMWQRIPPDFRVVKRSKVEYQLWSKVAFGSATPCASPPPQPSIFADYSFLVHHPVNRDDDISLHMQWPLTSQLHGSALIQNKLPYIYVVSVGPSSWLSLARLYMNNDCLYGFVWS
jgi:hypothetical protein